MIMCWIYFYRSMTFYKQIHLFKEPLITDFKISKETFLMCLFKFFYLQFCKELVIFAYSYNQFLFPSSMIMEKNDSLILLGGFFYFCKDVCICVCIYVCMHTHVCTKSFCWSSVKTTMNANCNMTLVLQGGRKKKKIKIRKNSHYLIFHKIHLTESFHRVFSIIIWQVGKEPTYQFAFDQINTWHLCMSFLTFLLIPNYITVEQIGKLKKKSNGFRGL